jgi:L-arabinokinase
VLSRAPDARVTVRTSAPSGLFEPLPPSAVERSEIDVGMAERATLTIDAKVTLERLVRLCADADQHVAEEVQALRALRPDVILADVPFLAGELGAAARIPCYAVSNFTWDWICDPLLAAEPAYAALRERMQFGYGWMSGCLQLPLGGVSESFRQVIPTPLIAGRSDRGPAHTLGAIGISPTDPRPRVLVALRGGVPEPALRTAAADAGEYLFLLPGGRTIVGAPPNIHAVPKDAAVTFADLVAASDVVLSKLGYGIVSDCIAANKCLLWPRRTGFREDDVVEREGPRYLRMRELPAIDFEAGWWRRMLDELMAAPEPPERMPFDGADRVASFVLGQPGTAGSSDRRR